ncbi:transposase [Ferrimonas sediminum]|uniref:transposase n=1 Tax=Ferrimonas sediminum TaxID=718193 RepID=UPI003CCC2711
MEIASSLYATAIADIDTHWVLWIGEGRSRKAIRPFFQPLGGRCQAIEAVAMDVKAVFYLEVAAHRLSAEVIYDLCTSSPNVSDR